MSQPSHPIQQALKLPNGARFYRCALQVNPFEYLKRHSKPVEFQDEDSYNTAMVEACRSNGVEVIAITDHYRVETSQRLREAAEQAGISVFPGFEAVTKDGVHFLCLFSPQSSQQQLERFIGKCGIQDDCEDSPISSEYDTDQLLEAVPGWNALAIAAHAAAQQGGLLRALSGKTRIAAWRHERLLACSLPGPVSDAPDDLRPILENRNPDYQREHPVAVLNAQDVSSPEDLARSGTSCFIKMAEVSIEGLRQAFLDPSSRIRLASDPCLEEHTELTAVSWLGGFLDGAALHLNENLNVLIGGRGAGKSTVIESLRYVLDLDPVGEEAGIAHERIVSHVLRAGTKISLQVRSHHPSKKEYWIERTVPNPPVVRDPSGVVLDLAPSDVVRHVEVYGQHEVSELARSPERRTRLLDRFIQIESSLRRRKADLRLELKRSRERLLDVDRELGQIDERLSALPGLEEALRRYREAGIEERFKEQSLLVQEERILETAVGRLEPQTELQKRLEESVPIDHAFISDKALHSLPGKPLLEGARAALIQLEVRLQDTAQRLNEALTRARSELEEVRERWNKRREKVEEEYEKTLRELQRSEIDGHEFIQLRRQVESLKALQERQASLQRNASEHSRNRHSLLVEWEAVKAEESRDLKEAARSVSQKLPGKVRVRVTPSGNRNPLSDLLRDEIGGYVKKTIDRLGEKKEISLAELVQTCRQGAQALKEKYQLPDGNAENLAQASSAVLMKIEELDLPATTQIELNLAPEGKPPQWQELERLSTGQKATAILLLLLLESDAPLIVDQPEDDLDNRFITEGIVPRMRQAKRLRQFIFSTHNANIPVLGDAELIVALTPSGEARQGRAQILPKHIGSIDTLSVREAVEDLLEGGKRAFETRRLKYGF